MPGACVFCEALPYTLSMIDGPGDVEPQSFPESEKRAGGVAPAVQIHAGLFGGFLSRVDCRLDTLSIGLLENVASLDAEPNSRSALGAATSKAPVSLDIGSRDARRPTVAARRPDPAIGLRDAVVLPGPRVDDTRSTSPHGCSSNRRDGNHSSHIVKDHYCDQ